MIEFIQGDIFDTAADIRVNTVNCVGAMGAGVALAFKKRYPEMFKDYLSACKSGQVKPGRMHVWKSLEGVWIINFPTKRDWREPSRYEDIDMGLDDLRQYLDSVGPVTVALPALGCGNGGLDWSRVSRMIREKLDGVVAHVYVLEPSASHRAGKETVFPTDDERKSAEQLGYNLLQSEQLLGLKATKPVYLMGSPEILSHKWIALLPSRSPGKRELQALQAISLELASFKSDIGVALVYGTKFSEEIANIFALQGVSTLLLLPFGVLTRKALGKRVAVGRSGALTIASMTAANEKWSPQLFAQSMSALTLNAGAILLSDPEPAWLVDKELSKWGRVPISYVRYETTPPPLREVLENFGAKPIARRGAAGAPNLDFLVTAFGDCVTTAANLTDLAAGGAVDDVANSTSDMDQKGDMYACSEMFSFYVHQQSQAELGLVVEAIIHMNVKEISVRLPVNANESDLRRLSELGFSRRTEQ